MSYYYPPSIALNYTKHLYPLNSLTSGSVRVCVCVRMGGKEEGIQKKIVEVLQIFS